MKFPVPTIINLSPSKISDEPTKNSSTVRFKFDMDIIAWELRALGTSPNSGVSAGSGGIVPKDTEVTEQIVWTELQQEGVNRLNLYGFDGAYWTPYDDNSQPDTSPRTLGTYKFGASKLGRY